MENKTVLITGCTVGIGRATAEKIANTGAKVIMACRNVEIAKRVKDELTKTTKNGKIIVRKLDLGSFKSIREFADIINREEPRLDVLIHNAGIALSFRRRKSEDGLELTMATNHFGPFLQGLRRRRTRAERHGPRKGKNAVGIEREADTRPCGSTDLM